MDRVRYESIAKSVIFVPLAISMVAASVIWAFMYFYVTPPEPCVKLLPAPRDRCVGLRRLVELEREKAQ